MRKVLKTVLVSGVLLVGTLGVGSAFAQSQADEVGEVAPSDTGVTAQQAQTAAEAAHPGAAVLAVEYDVEGGIQLFEVEFGDGTDVRVNANSGAILGAEVRDAD